MLAMREARQRISRNYLRTTLAIQAWAQGALNAWSIARERFIPSYIVYIHLQLILLVSVFAFAFLALS